MLNIFYVTSVSDIENICKQNLGHQRFSIFSNWKIFNYQLSFFWNCIMKNFFFPDKEIYQFFMSGPGNHHWLYVCRNPPQNVPIWRSWEWIEREKNWKAGTLKIWNNEIKDKSKKGYVGMFAHNVLKINALRRLTFSLWVNIFS